MALEIEKKYRLNEDEWVGIARTLNDSNANFIAEDFEENIIFDGNGLSPKQAVLRLRRIENRTILTYKERLPQQSDIKHQLEYETEIADFEAASRIFTSLGFTPSLIYEKQRRTWQLDDVEVVLDKLPFGLYMEIEGSIEGIERAEKLLGWENAQAVHETYPQLTAKLGKMNGGVIEARFESD